MKKTTIAVNACTGILASLLGASVQAEEAWTGNLVDMVAKGTVNFDFRYRYEGVDQDGFSRNAGSSVLRSRLTYTTGSLSGFSALAEIDNLSVIGSERYNSTENGKTQYPVVADPKGTDINQVLLKYKAETWDSVYGRQRINHNDQRFVGGVGWRQNEQTYDGFRATWKPADRLKLDYSYIYNVNRIFGPTDGTNPANLHGSNSFIYADYQVAEGHIVKGYGYLLDFDGSSGYPAGKTVNNASDTWGIEYSGDFKILTLRAAWATQSDTGDSELRYDADYYMADLAGQISKVSLNAGIEVLGGGDGVGFATPLATLHKFQGWADMFLGTPGDGVEDIYVGVSGKIGPVALKAIYHDFSAEDSSADWGSELDFVATWAATKDLTTQLHYADFNADEWKVDTQKFWVTLQLKL